MKKGVKASAGDINNDGQEEIITYHSLVTSPW